MFRSCIGKLIFQLFLIVIFTPLAFAQAPFPITPGTAIGTRMGTDPAAANSKPFPAHNGAVVLIMDVSNPVGMRDYSLWLDQPQGSLRRYSSPNWTSEKLGQLFGIALGKQGSSDFFVAATGIYGVDANPFYFAKNGAGNEMKGAVWRLNPMGGLGSGGATDYELVANLPSSAASLGSIAYNSKAYVLYVSNFFDGKIYALAAPGNTSNPYTANQTNWLDTYPSLPPVYLQSTDVDSSTALGYPFGSTTNQIAAYGSRIWAIAYNPNEDRLYYARVWVDFRNAIKNNAVNKNEIWSVALDGFGKFVPGSSRLELKVPFYPIAVAPQLANTFSFGVSGISFTNDGKAMAIAERGELLGHAPNPNGYDYTGAHLSRIMTYALTTTSTGRQWLSTDPPGGLGTFDGEWNWHANSAGGVDFGDAYSSSLSQLDVFLWSTMNSYNSSAYILNAAAIPNALSKIYGAQGMQFSDAKTRVEPQVTLAAPLSTASPTFVTDPPKLFFVDYDGNVQTVAKNQIGDVKVRRKEAVAPVACNCATVESYTVKEKILYAKICTPALNFSEIRVVQGDLILTPFSISPPLPLIGPPPFCVDIQVQLTGTSAQVHFELASEANADTSLAQCCRTPIVTVKLPKGGLAQPDVPIGPPK